jgi:hypothetical protein
MNNSVVFRFYRFIGPTGQRTTELIRDYSQADGMRGLVDHNQQAVNDAVNKVTSWASAKGVSLKVLDPFPSSKYPGKVWLEARFSGLTL